MPQQGGISPCTRGTTELGHGGTLGATLSLCRESLHWFLPLNHIDTQRTGIQHKPTTRGFCVTLHLGYVIYHINAAFAAGFAPSLGVFPNIGK